MGRRRKLERQLRIGALYFVDRRIKKFQVFRRVLSRQNSVNMSKDNLSVFRVGSLPEETTIMVVSHETFYGKDYSKIIVGSNSNSTIGYILISSLKKLVRGKLKWRSLKFD
jgi:hypothetical protein